MPDRAAEVAEYVTGARGVSIAAMLAETTRRWPGLTEVEFVRGCQIAKELLRAEAAEHFAEADALDALAAKADG